MKLLTVDCFALLLERTGIRHQRQNSIYYQFALYPTAEHIEQTRKEGGEIHPTWLINVIPGLHPFKHKLDIRDVTDKRPKMWLFVVIKKKAQRVEFNGILTPARLSEIWNGREPASKKVEVAPWDLVELDDFFPLVQYEEEIPKEAEK